MQNQAPSPERNFLFSIRAKESPVTARHASLIRVERRRAHSAAPATSSHTGFYPYRPRMTRFHSWFRERLDSDVLIALRDYDRIMLEKKRPGTRTWWHILMGNWLRNWKVPPNPHDHLPRYLTPEQLEAVYKVPRNSKEQVDLVISYIDTDNAIDDALRAEAYELFERSPRRGEVRIPGSHLFS
jgi:hypothetical protein